MGDIIAIFSVLFLIYYVAKWSVDIEWDVKKNKSDISDLKKES